MILGGIGSGKSITAMKEMFQRDVKTFCNFDTSLQNVIRLKVEHIITEHIIGTKKDGTPIKELSINWDFWNSQRKEPFDIVIDEVHNVLHSRRSMTKWNTLFSMWLSQIRKILGSSENNHLYLISQRFEAIDISARELAGEIIYCIKQMIGQNVWIIKYRFRGERCIDSYTAFIMGQKSYSYKTIYLANPYFKLYHSYDIIPFGESVYI